MPTGFVIAKGELHHFSDAAPDLGLGQCSYLRLIDPKGSVHVSFIFGKAKVPPLKFMTVPRLELNAAVLAVRAARLIKKEMSSFIERYKVTSHFWSDSKVVLGYIKGCQGGLKPLWPIGLRKFIRGWT